MDLIVGPWPWYVSGHLIALTMLVLLLMGKRFGMSSNLRTLCAMCGAGKNVSFFNFDWKAQRWNLIVITGVILGAFIAHQFLMEDTTVAISEASIASLNEVGFTYNEGDYLPQELYGENAMSNPKTLIILIVAGFLVGFGTRYAGGCTSGHAISGLSNLQLPSLIAVIGFFIGGLAMVHIIFPLIF